MNYKQNASVIIDFLKPSDKEFSLYDCTLYAGLGTGGLAAYSGDLIYTFCGAMAPTFVTYTLFRIYDVSSFFGDKLRMYVESRDRDE